MAYAPAQNTTLSSGLAHLATIFYNKTGLDRLQKTFRFREAGMEDDISKQVGKTVQWFRYNNFAANTTPTAVEGGVGTSLSISSRIVQATVSEYSDFINLSTFLNDTAIDKTVENMSDLLGYRGGLSVDTITRNVIDAESSSTNLSLTGTYLRVADLRNAAHQLQGVDVEPMEDDLFYTIAHPYNLYDLINDPAAGGLADIFKYTSPDKAALVDSGNAKMSVVASVGGCRIVRSTNVAVSGSAPNRTWRVYVFGKNGIGVVGLSGSTPADVRDPMKQRFNVNINRYKGGSVADPEGQIAASVAYRYVYTTVVLEGPSGIGGSYRYRTMDAASSIAG